MSRGLQNLLWFMGVAFVLLVAFGIGQPFIWEYIVEKPPPAATTILPNVLTILIALLMLGIAAFGGGAYYILSRRIKEETVRAAQEEYLEAVVTLHTHVSALWGRLYEGLQNIVPSEQLVAFIDQATNYGKMAERGAGRLDVKTREELILRAKNNYAMALALKADRGTANEAANLAKYLEESFARRPEEEVVLDKETVAFVAWRLPRKPQDILRSIEYLSEAWHQTDSIRRRCWIIRWKQFPKGNFKE